MFTNMSVLASIANLFRFNSKNWKAIALCFLAATIFWFFNALNKNYTTNINFPLEFEFDKDAFIPVKPLPAQVRINVTGMGWDLFRRSSGLKVPALTIPLERPSEVKKIVASPALFAPQLERFEINFILTDTFRVNLEPKEKRWVTLRLDATSIKLRNNYVRTSEPTLEPDSIFIEGPLSLVNSFIEPVYLKLADQEIDENYREDVEVEFVNNELISRNPPTVSVTFKVDKLIELNDSLPIRIINYPKGANPYLGMKGLPCNFSVPESLMNQYFPDSVFAVIDLKFFVRGTQKIKPDVVGLPPYSQINRIDSVFVKF
jgi:hypothetical protein